MYQMAVPRVDRMFDAGLALEAAEVVRSNWVEVACPAVLKAREHEEGVLQSRQEAVQLWVVLEEEALAEAGLALVVERLE